MANDISTHSVMAVLDTAGPPTAIHALLFDSRRHHDSESRLLDIRRKKGQRFLKKARKNFWLLFSKK
jgi:hypothetical protein